MTNTHPIDCELCQGLGLVDEDARDCPECNGTGFVVPRPTLPTFTVVCRGEEITFTSAFATLAEAYRALHTQQIDIVKNGGKGSGFAGDLLLAAQGRRLSPRQAAWLHKLATDAKNPPPRKTTELSLTKLVEFFTASGRKRCRIVLTDGGTPIALSKAGGRSRFPGTINITDGKPFGENKWFGRIQLDGTVQCSRSWDNVVETRLRELAEDPAGVASRHGHITGRCCFCNRTLTTDESIAVGYGPVCAGTYNLPWGAVAAKEVVR